MPIPIYEVKKKGRQALMERMSGNKAIPCTQ